MFLSYWLLGIFFIAFADGRVILMPKASTALIRDAALKCSPNVNIQEFFGILNEGTYREDDDFKRLVFCVNVESGFAHKNGRLSVDAIKALFTNDKELIATVMSCDKVLATPFETNWSSFKCFQDTTPVQWLRGLLKYSFFGFATHTLFGISRKLLRSNMDPSYWLLGVFFIGFTDGRFLVVPKDSTDIIKEAAVKCSPSVNIQEFFGILNEGKYQEDDDFKQLIFCTYVESGFAHKNGRLNVEAISVVFSGDKDMITAVRNCDKVLATPFETNWNSFKCFQDTTPVRYRL